MTTHKRRMIFAQILQEILNNSDSDIAHAESTYSESESVNSDMRAEVESDESEADDGKMDNNFRFFGYHGYHH